MASCRGQINAENLKRQDRPFIEDYAERYDLSKSLSTEEIIFQIFSNGRKVIPILQQHLWEGDQENVQLVRRLEIPENEAFLADERPHKSTSLLLPETFPSPPQDTYSPSPPGTPGSPRSGSPANESHQEGYIGPPTRMPFVYPPKGRPRRDSKGQVKEGEFDPLPDKWLIEMLMDFERGRLDLSTDLQQLSQVVKEASHQVLSLCAGIKNERKDTKIFLDAIEKICGNEILDQIKADARATVLASRNNLEPQSQTDNDLPQGRVKIPVNRKNKSIFGINPLPASTATGPLNTTPTNPRIASPSGSGPKTSKLKRSFPEINEEGLGGVDRLSPSSDTSHRIKRTKHTDETRDDSDGGEGDSDSGDDSAPKSGGSFFTRLLSGSRFDPKRAVDNDDEDGHDEPAPHTPLRPSSRRPVDVSNGGESHRAVAARGERNNAAPVTVAETPAVRGPFDLQTPSTNVGSSFPRPSSFSQPNSFTRKAALGGERGNGSSTSSPFGGESTTAPAPIRGRPLTRQYAVANLKDLPWWTDGPSTTAPQTARQTPSPPVPDSPNAPQRMIIPGGSSCRHASTEAVAGSSPTSGRHSGRIGTNPFSFSRDQAEAHATSSQLVATTSAAASSSAPSSYPSSSSGSDLPQPFRIADLKPPAPPTPPSPLRGRPLRREREILVQEPVTKRYITWVPGSGEPDFAAAREGQAREDVATFRRLAGEMYPITIDDGEPDFMDEDEEIRVGVEDDLPV